MNETTAFTLACRNGHSQPPVLRDVACAARLDGTLFELTLRQTYRNTGTELLEVVYTFPLPPRGVLLSFATELNGARMSGTVLPRKQAERQYENALADGDAPVMLEAHADGLHTANIGNLKPGDEIVVEVRMAQVVALEQGRLRLVVPSTIAPRHGDPLAAGLQPQQAPVVSFDAEYLLALTLHVGGALADAAVECPTHRVVSRRGEAGLEIALAPEARLDRDVVLVVTPKSSADAVVTQARDSRAPDAPTVLLATLPVPEAPRRDGIALKLLVDCSGSMGGDSMTSARRALNGVAAGLTAADAVAFARFGSTVEIVSGLAMCTPAELKTLTRHIEKTDANLGGTEMEGALSAVFAIPARVTPPRVDDLRMRVVDQPAPGGGLSDVLLITDGEVWNVDGIVETARKAAQRVFVIGVGSSPAEGALRRLAQATGGACEFATPGEALEAAAQRMLARIRQQAWTHLRIDWGGEAAWQGDLPLCAFAGDTLAVFAGVRGEPLADAPVRLVSRSDAGVDIVLASTSQRAVTSDDALPRVAAAGRLAALSPEAATSLAVGYQLMSPHTHCVLVHVRAQADKATEDAQLHRVESMLAAGWGGTGSVMAEERARGIAPMMDMMSPSPVMASHAGGAMPRMAAAAPGLRRRPSPARKLRGIMAETEASSLAQPPGRTDGSASDLEVALASIAQAMVDLACKRIEMAEFTHLQRASAIAMALTQAIDELDRVAPQTLGRAIDTHLLNAMFVRWVDARQGSRLSDALPESTKLRLSRLDPVILDQADAIFDRHVAQGASETA